MKNKIIIISNLILIFLLLLFQSGCSSRNAEPIIAEDSTIVYPPKQPDGLIAKITFCKKVGKRQVRELVPEQILQLKIKQKFMHFLILRTGENCRQRIDVPC